ncbi:MAG: hypothetical protein GY926_19520 [bacterium]|nr:hypothetical protein [bacterium]
MTKRNKKPLRDRMDAQLQRYVQEAEESGDLSMHAVAIRARAGVLRAMANGLDLDVMDHDSENDGD